MYVSPSAYSGSGSPPAGGLQYQDAIQFLALKISIRNVSRSQPESSGRCEAEDEIVRLHISCGRVLTKSVHVLQVSARCQSALVRRLNVWPARPSQMRVLINIYPPSGDDLVPFVEKLASFLSPNKTSCLELLPLFPLNFPARVEPAPDFSRLGTVVQRFASGFLFAVL